MRFFDSLANLITGMGGPKAKRSATVYTYVPMTPGELDAAYRGSWLAKKVVDIPAKDMCREWRLWQAEDDQIEKIEAEEVRLGLQAKTLEAKRKARLFGGAAVVISDGTTDLLEELRPERIGLRGIPFLTVMTCRLLTAGEIETDPLSPWCGQPKFYHMRSNGRDVRIHPSRLVRHFGAASAEDDQVSTVTGWADSSLEAVHQALKDAETAAANISEMTHEGKLDIIRIPNLMAFASDQEYEARFLRRMTLAMTAKSMHNTLILDKEEEYEQKQITFATLPDVLDRFLQIASGAADIPATRLLGQSPAGMNATGESDLRNYYDRIAAEQRLELSPAMALLDECLIRSALGSRPPEIHYKWAPLWQMGEKDRAEVNLKNAQAFQIDVSSGLFPDSALSKGRINQCVEAGTYPGLENALDEAEGEGDAIDFAAKAEEPESQPAPVVRMQAAANDGEGGDAARPFDDKFNPRQPRGKNGKWVSSGGGGGFLARAFSEQQKVELQDYKEGNFRGLNSYLRKPDSVRPSLGAEYERQAKTLDGAFKRSRLAKDAEVYRGLSHPVLAQHAEKLVGKELDVASFQSTSRDRSVASSFAGRSDGVIFKITAKQGTPAIEMDQFATGGNAGEAEVLFARNSKLRVTSVTRENGTPIIHAEIRS